MRKARTSVKHSDWGLFIFKRVNGRKGEIPMQGKYSSEKEGMVVLGREFPKEVPAERPTEKEMHM